MVFDALKFRYSFFKKAKRIKLKKKNNHIKTKRDLLRLSIFDSSHKWLFIFYIPSMWDVFFIKNNGNSSTMVMLFSPIYKFTFCFNNSIAKLKYDINASAIVLWSTFSHNSSAKYLTKFREVLFSFSRPIFKKVKFKGKGYYLYKNYRNTITPQFGYAHRIYFYSYFASVKFLSKTSVFIFGLVSKDICSAAYGIKVMRPINIFTGRGVRFARQTIYRKVGKVSSYR